MNGADALVRGLESGQIEYVFGIPGTHVLAAYDALSHSKIKTIQTTHEQGAGFMADAYGRVSHTPGVALVTTGPGALNIVNAVAQAYVESSPVVVISGQCNSKGWGKGLYHELRQPNSQLNIFSEITKFAKRANSGSEIYPIVSEALFSSIDGRPRPSFVEIPENIFDEPSDPTTFRPFQLPQKLAASPEQITAVLSAIHSAKRPVLFVGGGVICSGAEDALLTFSKTLRIPLTTTIMGKSVCPVDFSYGLGIGSGILATDAAKEALSKSDLVIGIGTRFDEVATGFFSLRLPKLIHVDVDSGEFNRNYPAFMTVQADAKMFLNQMILVAKSSNHAATRPNHKTKKSPSISHSFGKTNLVHPQILFDTLFELLKTDRAIFVGDSGNSSMWLLTCENHSKHLVLTPSGYNSMGFSIPGGIGAKLASPQSTVVSICGDGSFLMTGMELLTAVKYGIKVICVVLNDSKYNILTFFQDLKYAGRYSDTLIKTFNFSDFAKNAGALGLSVNSDDQIEPAFKKALAHSGPSLIDVRIRPNVVPPILLKLKK